MKKLVSFATRWSSEFGGINSFNLRLLEATAIAFDGKVEVSCVVPCASEAEKQSAIRANVNLISLNATDSEFESSRFVVALLGEMDFWQKQPLGELVWLGHDRITGDLANHAAASLGGASAVIHHMSYLHYEAFAESSGSQAKKTEQQREVFLRANTILAVGPVLRDAVKDLARSDCEVTMLIPGLPEIAPSSTPSTFCAYISGRFNPQAGRIKQAQLGIAAFAHAIHLADQNPGLPDALHPRHEPRLSVRGVAHGVQGAEGLGRAEADLRLFAEQYAHRAIGLGVLPFTSDHNGVLHELGRASVALMPSWHEGFGLVGWEAIGAGVPLIVSIKSGLYKFLCEFEEGVFAALVAPVDVRGSSEAPYFRVEDLDDLSGAIIGVAKDPAAARRKAAKLREALSGFTWANCAVELIAALKWEIPKGQLGNSPTERATSQDGGSASTLAPSSAWISIPKPVWMPGRGLSESHLLRAEERRIPFDSGREPFLLEQLDWVRDEKFDFSVRLIAGPGGVGKTRLALELCQRLEAEGWRAGFLKSTRATDFRVIAAEIERIAQPCLLVIDYAEARQGDVIGLLGALIPLRQLKVRILLLARDGGEWWEQLADQSEDTSAFLKSLAASGPFTVPALHISESQRIDAYRNAVSIFAKLLGAAVPRAAPDLSAPHFAHPLYIQMSALAALAGDIPNSAEGLPRVLVAHEERYWRIALEDLPGADLLSIKKLMAVATLTGGITNFADVRHLLDELSLGNQHLLKAAYAGLASLYPDEDATGLQPLRPDLLGEALVANVLLSDGGGQYLRCIVSCSGPRARRFVFAFLARALSRRNDLQGVIEEVLSPSFSKYAKEIVEACCQVSGSFSGVAQRMFRRLSPAEKRSVSGVLEPYFNQELIPLLSLELDVSEVRVASAAAKYRKKPAIQSRLDYSQKLNSHSVSLSRCGAYEEALAAALQSMQLVRPLYESDNKRHAHRWAHRLQRVSGCLVDLGRGDEALEYLNESLGIREELARRDSRYEDDLAAALLNYANRLSDKGEADDALKFTERAVLISERLAANSAGAELRVLLASALNNYYAYLSDVGRVDEAERAGSRSLKLWEALSKEHPESFEYEWARSMHNRANGLAARGDYEGALDFVARAATIFARLAKWKPERFASDLAQELGAQGHLIISIEPSSAAVDFLVAAEAAYRAEALRLPRVHMTDWIDSKLNVLLARRVLGETRDWNSELSAIQGHIDDLQSMPQDRATVEFSFTFTQFCVSGDPEKALLYARRAVSQWNALDTSTKNGQEHSGYVLLSFWVEANLSGPEPEIQTWLSEVLLRRRGRMPWWVTECIRRMREVRLRSVV